MKMKNLISYVLAASLLACTSSEKSKMTDSGEPISIMSFNVENLFDAEDDPGKSDETYLPLARKQSVSHKKKCSTYPVEKWKRQCLDWDWSESVLKVKLDRIGKVIAQVNEGKGPDIVVFQEVENVRVLNRLKNEKLSSMGYHEVVLVEGRDQRGIDIAILTRLKLLGEPQLHYIPFKGVPKKRVEDTRGILQADFQLPYQKKLTVFGVHFPSPFHPVEMRVQAFQELKRLKGALPADRLIVAAGDFNVPADEDKKTGILDKYAKQDWLISHRIGCKGCQGTHYYPPKKSWSFLDMILLSRNFSSGDLGWKVLPESVRLVNSYPEQVTKEGYPNSFELPEVTGVSDHWPIVVDIAPVKK